MAYYDALIAKWAQAPAGTNDQKLTWVNAQTATGPAIKMLVASTDLYNHIDRAEYEKLTNANQASVQRMLSVNPSIDISLNTEMRAHFLLIFPTTGVAPVGNTQAKLAPWYASYDTPTIPWWQSAGYPHQITGQDLVLAGIQPAVPVTPLPPH